MGKSDVGSPKWVAKQMKLKGLQRLRWYCQACEKQCRDEHGFRLHTQSPSHAVKVESAKANQHHFSEEFEKSFMYYLKLHHSKPVGANRVYNEMIQDKQHVHMNSTRFKTLTGFIKYLESKNALRINSTEPELIVQHIDLEAQQRKEREFNAQRRKRLDQESIEKEVLESAIEAQKESDSKLKYDQPSISTKNSSGSENPTVEKQNDEVPAQEQPPNNAKRPKIGFSLKKK